MSDETQRFIAEQQKRIRRSIHKKQTLARRRLNGLEDQLTVIADQIVETVAHNLVSGVAEIEQQFADLKQHRSRDWSRKGDQHADTTKW